MTAAGLPAGAGNRIVAGGTTTTWGELEPLDLPPAAAVLVDDNLGAARAVWTAATTGTELLVVSRTRMTPALAEDLRAAGLAIVDGDDLTPPTTGRDATPGRIWLLTSGTTESVRGEISLEERFVSLIGELQPGEDMEWLRSFSS